MEAFTGGNAMSSQSGGSYPWFNQEMTLADAYSPRPPTQYTVEPGCPESSVNIWYGSPGALKSALLADMSICVAAGQSCWLSKALWENKTVPLFKVTQSPVVWIDYDNGASRTSNRFGAFGRAYNARLDIPLFYYSFPAPDLNATSRSSNVKMKIGINL